MHLGRSQITRGPLPLQHGPPPVPRPSSLQLPQGYVPPGLCTGRQRLRVLLLGAVPVSGGAGGCPPRLSENPAFWVSYPRRYRTTQKKSVRGGRESSALRSPGPADFSVKG